MSEQDKAREKARLLLEWADGKTLQRAEKPGEWTDWDGPEYPLIIVPSWWRIKPEPRRKWGIVIAPLGGMRSHSITFCAETAARWKAEGHTVTEWMEVVS